MNKRIGAYSEIIERGLGVLTGAESMEHGMSAAYVLADKERDIDVLKSIVELLEAMARDVVDEAETHPSEEDLARIGEFFLDACRLRAYIAEAGRLSRGDKIRDGLSKLGEVGIYDRPASLGGFDS